MDKKEFRLMVEDNQSAPSPYRPSDLVWKRLSDIFQEQLNSSGVGNVESNTAFNASFASYGRRDKRYQRFATHLGGNAVDDPYLLACQLFYNTLKLNNPSVTNQVVISPVSQASGMNVDVGDKQVTWDFLLSLDAVQSMVALQPRLLTDALTIVDLGSGWGRVGSVLCQLNPKLTYVCCDIPTSLIISQEYLPQHLPNVPVTLHSMVRNIDKIARKTLSDAPGFWFCGPQHLERFDDGSVDVFVNLYSLQEMTMQQNVEYFSVIDRVAKGGTFFTQQRLISDAMTRENYPYLSTWQREFDCLTKFSPNYFEASFSL